MSTPAPALLIEATRLDFPPAWRAFALGQMCALLAAPAWSGPTIFLTSPSTHGFVREELARVQDRLVCLPLGGTQPPLDQILPREEAWFGPLEGLAFRQGAGVVYFPAAPGLTEIAAGLPSVLAAWDREELPPGLEPPRLRAPWALAREGEAEILLVAFRQLLRRAPGTTLHLPLASQGREAEIRTLARALGLAPHLRWHPRLEDWDGSRDVLVLIGDKPDPAVVRSAQRRGVPVLTDRDAAFQSACGGSLHQVDHRRPDLLAGQLAQLVGTRPSSPPARWLTAAADQLDRQLRSAPAPAPFPSLELPPRAAAVGHRGPKISVVVPSFNQAAYLRATIESILAAAETESIEVRVFDGGSTDGSIDILREYDGRIFWISRPDRGQADAINQGLAGCTGEIVAYLNSDDVYLPGGLGHIARHFRDHPATQIAYGRAHHLKADGTFLEEYPTEPWDWPRLLETCFLCQPAVFWRREVLERFGTFDPELHFAMDYEYWLRVGRGQPFVYLDQLPPLAGSRLHEATKTLGSRVRVHREIIQVVRRYARNPAPVHRWLGHLAHCRAELEVPVVIERAQRRQFARRWAAHVLAEAAGLGIPVDTTLRGMLEDHLHLNGITS